MKTATHPRRGRLPQGLISLAVLLGTLGGFCSGRAAAETVDTELLLLVDVSNGGLKKGEFEVLMNGYADALTSAEVLAAIQSGAAGRIAVSLAYTGSDPADALGVSWMSVGSLAEAEAFANQLRGLADPSGGSLDYVDGLAAAVPSFGTETGAAANGFESAVQVIEIAGATKPKGSSARLASATTAAFDAGVDQIGATVVGGKAATIESYYASYVVGGAVGSAVGTATSGDLASGIEATLSARLSASVSGGAEASVPEPSTATSFIAAMAIMVLLRRRRD